MCGRFTNRAKSEQIKKEFKVGNENSVSFEPRYNIAPTQMIDVVLETEQERTLSQLKWGLVPSWSKDPDIGNRMINARAETITEKPAFREAFRKRRCIVPASGFYEWKRASGGSAKQPFYFYLNKGTFSVSLVFTKNGSTSKRANCSKPTRLSRQKPMKY